MAHALTSSMSQIKAEDVCRVFGHYAKRYGDGVYCKNCDMPMKDEDVAEIKIYRNSNSKQSWIKKYPSFK